MLRLGQRPLPLPRHLQASAGPSSPKAAASRCPVLAPALELLINIPEPICFLLSCPLLSHFPRLASLTAAYPPVLSPPLNFPSLFLFCIVLPALTTTSLHAARHASLPPSLRPGARCPAGAYRARDLRSGPFLSLPRPPPLTSSTARARRVRATANARSLLPHPHLPHPIPDGLRFVGRM